MVYNRIWQASKFTFEDWIKRKWLQQWKGASHCLQTRSVLLINQYFSNELNIIFNFYANSWSHFFKQATKLIYKQALYPINTWFFFDYVFIFAKRSNLIMIINPFTYFWILIYILTYNNHFIWVWLEYRNLVKSSLDQSHEKFLNLSIKYSQTRF